MFPVLHSVAVNYQLVIFFTNGHLWAKQKSFTEPASNSEHQEEKVEAQFVDLLLVNPQ